MSTFRVIVAAAIKTCLIVMTVTVSIITDAIVVCYLNDKTSR